MKGLAQKALVLAVTGLALCCVGCQQEEVPDARKARLIAAENMQLKKDLQQRDGQIEKLKDLHDKEMRQREQQMTKCVKQRDALEKQLQENIQEKVDEVLTNLMEENAKLRQEVQQLKAQMEEPQ